MDEWVELAESDAFKLLSLVGWVGVRESSMDFIHSGLGCNNNMFAAESYTLIK